jgi:hypothetical protein
MNQNFESAIRKRLFLEKSVLHRNVKAFAESRGIGGSTTVTTPRGRKKSEKTPDQLKREKSFLDLLSEYEKWQGKQAKRSGPVDWLDDEAKWSSKSKSFFKVLCREKDATAPEIVTNAIKYARKLSRSQVSSD